MSTYPHKTDDGRTIWACCVSDIGPVCRHQVAMDGTHNGVLVPDEMLNKSVAELDAYAASVKEGNRAFIGAVHALEDRALELGVELDA